MTDCLFCKIIAGEIPCHKIWEDESHLAFLDIFPMRPGHALVIPKTHAPEIFDLDDAAYDSLMRATRVVANRLRAAMSVPRVGVVVKGFEVDHVHVHLVPISEARQMDPCKAAKEIDHAALAEVARKIVGA
ncbi:MAG: HIT family protein [Candidatus Uhrbacteria bacterium]